MAFETYTAGDSEWNILRKILMNQSQGGGGGGSGTVTSVSVTTANGVSGTVANATSTPAITITLGAITPSSINGTTPTTAGLAFLGLANPSAITFPRINADNTVSALTAAAFRTAIGAGTGGGDVVGPASSADNRLVIFDSTTGKLIKDSTTITAATSVLTGAATLTGTNAITSAAGTALTIGTGTTGVAITVASATNAVTLSQGSLNFTGATAITGGAGNMTVVSGSGASRTMIFRTTTSGSVVTTALTLNDDQTATFASTISIQGLNSAGGLTVTGGTPSNVLIQTAAGANTSADGFYFWNNQQASSGNQQWSPRIRFIGSGWKTDATAASQNVQAIIEMRPVQGAANPSGLLAFAFGINGGANNDRMTLTSAGALTLGTPNGGTAAAWKFGTNVTSGTSVFDATGYVELDVNGTLVKVARVTNS